MEKVEENREKWKREGEKWEKNEKMKEGKIKNIQRKTTEKS